MEAAKVHKKAGDSKLLVSFFPYAEECLKIV